MNPVQHILVFALRVYRAAVSPVLTAVFAPLGFGCRFTPTCSEYALDAVRQHGALKGVVLATRRLCRCHPWGDCGCDPVPPRKLTSPPAISETGCSRDHEAHTSRESEPPHVGCCSLETGFRVSSLHSCGHGS